MTSIFECEELVKMKEYSGCKIDRNCNQRWVKLTQPVMVHILQDYFELYAHGKYPGTPNKPGEAQIKGENKVKV